MGLEKYSELEKKVKAQMQSQIEEVEILIAKGFAQKYNIDIGQVSTYQEAKKQIEEHVNTTTARRKEFHKFEEETRSYLVENVKELEYGASSDSTKKLRNIGKKAKPVLNAVTKAVLINFLAYNAIDLGLKTLGEVAYDNATIAIKDMDLIGDFEMGDIDTPWGIGEKVVQNIADSVETSVNGFIDEGENKIRSGLTSLATGAYNTYENKVAPMASKVSAGILGFFQAKGLIKNLKVKGLENQVDEQKEKTSKLELQNRMLQERTAMANSKEGTGIQTYGKQAQMVLLVNNLRELFESEGINFKLPNPEECLSMEEYGDSVKKQIQMQGESISKDDIMKINTILDIYRNSIDRMSKKATLGKAGVLERNC